VLQVRRQIAGERHASSVARVCERQTRGVQKRAVQVQHRADVARHTAVDAAVERIAHDRMADRAQVHADLMRATGVDGDACERQHTPEVLGVNDARHRFARAARPRRHLLAVRRITADRRVDAPARHHLAPYEGTYSFSTSRSWNCRASSSCARSCLAITISPDVPRSSRCTMPGRFSPPTPLRSSM
jgi:hypothetical protein